MSVQPYMPGFEGEQRSRERSQWYTPPWLAERVWVWMARAHSAQRLSVLEPSAGRGALLKPLWKLNVPVRRVVAYDIDPGNVDALTALLQPTGLDFGVRHADFLVTERKETEQ